MDAAMSLAARSSASDDKGPQFLVLTCVLTVLTLISTALRCFSRVVERTLGWDDYLIAAAAVLTIGRTGLQIASVKHGNGRHVDQLSDAQRQWVVMQGWYTQIILFPTLCLLKCSICLLLLRIKNTFKTRWTLIVIMVGLVLTNLEPIIILLAECSPLKTYWDPDAGVCWDAKIRIYSIYAQVAYSILTDFICSLMPVYVVYNIQMPRRDKWLLCGLMSLGLVATVCAAVRATSLGTQTTDLTYDYCIVAMWANSELHLGITATNAACGRHIYSALRYGRNPPPKESRGGSRSTYLSSRSRAGYLRGEGNTTTTTAESTRSENNRFAESTESQIPLQDGITKVTEYRVDSESPMGSPYTQREAATKWLDATTTVMKRP